MILDKKNSEKLSLKNYTQPNTREDIQATLINKGFKLAEKIPQKEWQNPTKHQDEKPLAYVATYKKNNPELFTEIIKKYRT